MNQKIIFSFLIYFLVNLFPSLGGAVEDGQRVCEERVGPEATFQAPVEIGYKTNPLSLRRSDEKENFQLYVCHAPSSFLVTKSKMEGDGFVLQEINRDDVLLQKRGKDIIKSSGVLKDKKPGAEDAFDIPTYRKIKGKDHTGTVVILESHSYDPISHEWSPMTTVRLFVPIQTKVEPPKAKSVQPSKTKPTASPAPKVAPPPVQKPLPAQPAPQRPEPQRGKR